jgi:hypothetical protein
MLFFSAFGILNSEWLANVCLADLRAVGRNSTIGNDVFGPGCGCELPGVKIDYSCPFGYICVSKTNARIANWEHRVCVGERARSVAAGVNLLWFVFAQQVTDCLRARNVSLHAVSRRFQLRFDVCCYEGHRKSWRIGSEWWHTSASGLC